MLSMSPTTPGTQGVQLSYANSPISARGQTFKRPASSDDEAENGEDAGGRPHSRRHAAVKRACNECRQQKVRAIQRIPQKTFLLRRQKDQVSPAKHNRGRRRPLCDAFQPWMKIAYGIHPHGRASSYTKSRSRDSFRLPSELEAPCVKILRTPR